MASKKKSPAKVPNRPDPKPITIQLRHEIFWTEEVTVPAQCPECNEPVGESILVDELSSAAYEYAIAKDGSMDNRGCEEIPETLPDLDGRYNVRCYNCSADLITGKCLNPKGDELKQVLALAAVMDDARKARS